LYESSLSPGPDITVALLREKKRMTTSDREHLPKADEGEGREMSPMLVPSHSLPQTRSPQSVSQSDEASVLSRTQLDAHRALKSREERMVTPAMGAAMIDQMYSLRENGAQDGGRGFHLRLSTL